MFKKIFSTLFFSAIMLINLFFAFAIIYTSEWDPIWIRIITFLFALSPIGFFGGMIFLYIRADKKVLKFSTIGITIVSFFISLIYWFFGFMILGIYEFANPITSLDKYSSIVKSFGFTDIFPKKISNSWNNVNFYYQPGFLQGATTILLYYTDASVDNYEFNNKYKDKAKWVGLKSDYEGKSLTSSEFYPFEIENEDNFKIYLIDEDCDDTSWCNHGYYLLVGINEETKEVIYAKSSW